MVNTQTTVFPVEAAPKKTRKSPAKKVVEQEVSLPPPESEKKNDPRFCKHENLRKDRYGKIDSFYQPGKGMITHCADCGVKITSFHVPSQPLNLPGKIRMSKKDRRLGKKIQKEISKGVKKDEGAEKES